MDRSTDISRWARAAFGLLIALFLLVEGRAVVGGAEGVYSRFEDDAYYNFQVARNVAAGRGMTFDGASETNGVHPTAFLVALGFYLLFPDNPVAPLRGFAAFSLLVYLLIAWRLWRWGQRRLSETARVGLAAVWLGSPYFRFFGLGGCDQLFTAWFMISALLAYSEERGKPNPRLLRPGLWIGLAAFARLDQLALVAGVGLDWLLLKRPNRRVGVDLARLAGPAIVAVGLLSALHLSAFDHPISDNGRAVGAIAKGVATYDVDYGHRDRLFTPEEMEAIEVPVDFDEGPIRVNSLQSTMIVALYLVDLFAWDPWFLGGTPGRHTPGVVGVLLLAIAAGAALVLRARRRSPTQRPPAPWGYAGLFYALFFLLGYNLIVCAYWAFMRYYLPLVLLAAVLIARRLSSKPESGAATPGRRWALAAITLYGCLGLANPQTHFAYTRYTPDKATVDWLETHTPPGAKIGAFQAGYLTYRVGKEGRRVFNLDGKVSHQALEAYLNGRMDRYVESLGLDYLLDWPFVINYSYIMRSTGPPPKPLEAVHVFSAPYRMTLYRAP